MGNDLRSHGMDALFKEHGTFDALSKAQTGLNDSKRE